MAILSVALVFVLRGFSVIMRAARLSQDISLASLLAEEKAWEIGNSGAPAAGSVFLQGREFFWDCTKTPGSPQAPDLGRLELTITWQEPAGAKDRLSISTYLSVE